MHISKIQSASTAVFLLFSLANCHRNVSQQSSASPKPVGNPQTKTLRAASAVGYDGKKLQTQVDKILEQKRARDRDLEKQTENDR